MSRTARRFFDTTVLTAILAGLTMTSLISCKAQFPLSLLSDASSPDGRMDVSAQDAAPPQDGTVDTGLGDARPADAAEPDSSLPDAAEPDSSLPDAAETDASPTVCGNGVKEQGEACDDGNTDSGDGCSATCEVECSNGSVTDCNPPGQTLVASSAFVDQEPPEGFVQCAGFQNTSENDVGPHWDGNCLGAIRRLRIRYWDTSTNPWSLLGDAVLSPEEQPDFVTQVFDATNMGGSDEFATASQFTLLPDDPAGADQPTTEWSCLEGPTPKRYAATDLYFENNDGNRFVLVSGYSKSDDSSAIAYDRNEIARYHLGYEECVSNPGTPDQDLALALYYER